MLDFLECKFILFLKKTYKFTVLLTSKSTSKYSILIRTRRFAFPYST